MAQHNVEGWGGVGWGEGGGGTGGEVPTLGQVLHMPRSSWRALFGEA